MLPWLAMSHLIPFFELSKRLALKGVEISIFCTPSSIRRLPSIPQALTHLLTFIPCPLPPIQNLPSNIENTIDLQSEDEKRLFYEAYGAFERHLVDFLSNPSRLKPDWIIYDFPAASWAPSVATRFDVGCAYFALFNAAAMNFFDRSVDCESPEELRKVPDLLPFATAVNFRALEARRIFAIRPPKSDWVESRKNTQLLLIRTCREFEAKWIDSLLYKYAQVGFIPPMLGGEEEEDETWGRIRRWLDEREDFSVVYAAFGSEAKLTQEQIDEIGLGLERSGSPFFWVLRDGSPPRDFEERTGGRGMVWVGWVPQPRLLAHRAVGGFLTHGGWNSVVEGLAVGAAMVVLPMMYEQGLNARHLVESGYGVEVEANEEDGLFSGEDVGRKLRMVMVEEEGEEVRKKVRQGKEIFGSEKLQEEYIDEVIKKLWEKQEMEAKPV